LHNVIRYSIYFIAKQAQTKQSSSTKLTKPVKKYVVATQDKDLRNSLGNLPGIPLIYLNQVSLVFESPSTASREYTNEVSFFILFFFKKKSLIVPIENI
jgi:hypothetical protein